MIYCQKPLKNGGIKLLRVPDCYFRVGLYFSIKTKHKVSVKPYQNL